MSRYVVAATVTSSKMNDPTTISEVRAHYTIIFGLSRSCHVSSEQGTWFRKALSSCIRDMSSVNVFRMASRLLAASAWSESCRIFTLAFCVQFCVQWTVECSVSDWPDESISWYYDAVRRESIRFTYTPWSPLPSFLTQNQFPTTNYAMPLWYVA
jgi:hypothetical protein